MRAAPFAKVHKPLLEKRSVKKKRGATPYRARRLKKIGDVIKRRREKSSKFIEVEKKF